MTESLREQLAEKIGGLDVGDRKALLNVLDAFDEDRPWKPNAGPQTEAYYTDADVLLYGGQAGGGKSGLIVGLALTAHRRTLIMRRQYGDLSAIIEDLLEKHGSRRGFNGSPPAKLRIAEGDRLIEFGGAKVPGDEQHFRGQPHDLLAIDEASQFLESQVRFLMGWVRSVHPGQRTRTVLATNPPEDPATGQWLKRMFAPWLDPADPRPAQPGELRWCVTNALGEDQWVEGPGTHDDGTGRMVRAHSRTFIPAALKDNPYLRDTGYDAQLDALPEPLRSAVRDGNWMIAHEDDEYQIIPTNWLIAAQERWTADPPATAPMCAIGVDVARGGADHTVLAPRYDYWFAEPVSVPGRDTPLGTDVAALVVKHRRNRAAIVIDMGGGYGGAPYEHLRLNLEGENWQENPERIVFGYDGSKQVGTRTADRQLAFANMRAESWWRFREALDPDQEGESPIALPPDSELIADLVAPRWRLTPRGILVEGKQDIVKRLGRSPDKGDAVVMAWSHGASWVTHGEKWRAYDRSFGRQPQVVRGYEHRRRKR